jgi:hypothetical protein
MSGMQWTSRARVQQNDDEIEVLAGLQDNTNAGAKMIELETMVKKLMTEIQTLKTKDRTGPTSELRDVSGVNDMNERYFGNEDLNGSNNLNKSFNLDVKIEKLNDTNFRSWKKELEITLKNMDLWDILEGRKKFHGTISEREYTVKEAEIAYAILYKSLDRERKLLIVEVDNVYDAWKILTNKYQPKDLMTKGKTVQELFNCKMKNNEDMEQYINRVNFLYKEFLRVGHKDLDSELIVHVLLQGLGTEFEYVVSMVNTMNPEDVTIERVCNILGAEWKSRKGSVRDSNSESGAYAFRRDIRGRSIQARGNSGRTCFRCGRIGHIRDQCRVNVNAKFGESSGPRHWSGTACLKFREDGRMYLENKSGWLMDSGASDHVTFCRDDFVEFKEVCEYLVWGSDVRCRVKGKGNVLVRVSYGNRVEEIMLYGVLFVPEFSCRVYSLTKGTAKGWIYTLGNQSLRANFRNKAFYVAAKEKNGFYVANFQVVDGGGKIQDK